jgi:transmembrane sensor
VSVLRRPRNDIEAEAAEWVIRLDESRPLPADERYALDCWLAKNPAHKAAFEYAQCIWSDLAALKTAPGELARDTVRYDHGSPIVPFRRHRITRGMVLRAASVVALVVVATGLGAFWFGDPILMLEADYRTAPGESRRVTLVDGSIVQLNTDSAMAVHFDGQERRVELLSGKAYFTVAPLQGAESRPFVVGSTNGSARALGTQFQVNREGDGTDVTVAEHKVQVSMAESGDGPDFVLLSPGQAVHYDHASGLGPVTQTDVGRATAWRRGQLVFDRVRLADVVAELSRYRRGRIIIADTNLADRKVSGVFETADLDEALASITQELKMRTAALPPFVTVLY